MGKITVFINFYCFLENIDIHQQKMPIHSCLVVCSRDSRILFSKYYDRSILENPVLHTQFDRAVLDETCHYWGGSFRTFSILFDNISVVFGKIGNLILYLSGTDECDEIVCKYIYMFTFFFVDSGANC